MFATTHRVIMHWFSVVLFLLAIVFAFINPTELTFAEALLRWILFFNIGIQGLWIASQKILCSFDEDDNSSLFDVAVANLSLGVAGLFALSTNISYCIALSLVAGLFLLGSDMGYVIALKKKHSLSLHMTNPIFYTGLVVPAALFILCLTA